MYVLFGRLKEATEHIVGVLEREDKKKTKKKKKIDNIEFFLISSQNMLSFGFLQYSSYYFLMKGLPFPVIYCIVVNRRTKNVLWKHNAISSSSKRNHRLQISCIVSLLGDYVPPDVNL